MYTKSGGPERKNFPSRPEAGRKGFKRKQIRRKSNEGEDILGRKMCIQFKIKKIREYGMFNWSSWAGSNGKCFLIFHP